ncbi:hypothetical protein EVAR_44088_1 [Eumeta japonica]|uniref:Uncharacterized protein n=1 Tax=Eumeta variegata TaxID=151549 RepID=A0A4C1X0S0_EUMVA|nr:hypothetical protein EVAR_44088_1 [Eumeta japonica]
MCSWNDTAITGIRCNNSCFYFEPLGVTTEQILSKHPLEAGQRINSGGRAIRLITAKQRPSSKHVASAGADAGNKLLLDDCNTETILFAERM